MIHSMCGGKIDEKETVTFAKVSFFEGTRSEAPFAWYVAEEKVQTGDIVVVPVGYLKEEGKVEEVRECRYGVTPVPMRSAKYILAVK